MCDSHACRTTRAIRPCHLVRCQFPCVKPEGTKIAPEEHLASVPPPDVTFPRVGFELKPECILIVLYLVDLDAVNVEYDAARAVRGGDMVPLIARDVLLESDSRIVQYVVLKDQKALSRRRV